MSQANPFHNLRIQLVHENKPAAPATRLAYVILAAPRYEHAKAACAALDASVSFTCTTLISALYSRHFRHRNTWLHDYETLRLYAHSYLDSHRHHAAA